jgi:transcriptional regulator with XRE-family HTH domain
VRGIQINTTRFRQIRRARGFTQAKLARIAGVSERTVRNAELGRRVRLDFLRYLAIALGVEVLDVSRDPDELRVANRENERAERVLHATLSFAHDRDLGELRRLVDDNVFRLLYPGPSIIPFAGEYRGVDGLRKLMERVQESMAYEQPTTITEVRSSGNFVIVSGLDHLRSLSTGKPVNTWWQHIYEFSDRRLVRVDSLVDSHAVCSALMSDG